MEAGKLKCVIVRGELIVPTTFDIGNANGRRNYVSGKVNDM